MNHTKIKSFALWFYHNVFLKYLQIRYRTTLLTLARITLLVLAKEVVVPWIYWGAVLYNAIWPHSGLKEVLEAIQAVCLPSTVEVVIAVLAVVVLLIVAIAQYHTDKKKVNLLHDVYIPNTDDMLSQLNIGFYYEWTYNIAVSGSTFIGERQLDDLKDVANFLKFRDKHSEYQKLDELYASLSDVINDITRLYNYYGDFSREDEMVTIKKFYRSSNYNPNYDEELRSYNDICYLLSDLVFEMTRHLNLILKIIRDIQPDYLVRIGILHTDDNIEHGVYRLEEENQFKYKGLKEFMTIRETRSFHYGSGEVELWK